jgi:hypothetical protein
MSNDVCFSNLNRLLKLHKDELYKTPMIDSGVRFKTTVKIYLLQSFDSENVVLRQFVPIEKTQEINELLDGFAYASRVKIESVLSLVATGNRNDSRWKVCETDPITIKTISLDMHYVFTTMDQIPLSFRDYLMRMFRLNARQEEVVTDSVKEIINIPYPEQSVKQVRLDFIFPETFKEETYLRNVENRPRIFNKRGVELSQGFVAKYDIRILTIEFSRAGFKMSRVTKVTENVLVLKDDVYYANVDLVMEVFSRLNGIILKEREAKAEAALVIKDIFDVFADLD